MYIFLQENKCIYYLFPQEPAEHCIHDQWIMGAMLCKPFLQHCAPNAVQGLSIRESEEVDYKCANYYTHAPLRTASLSAVVAFTNLQERDFYEVEPCSVVQILKVTVAGEKNHHTLSSKKVSTHLLKWF